ncbi:type II toxin-antitoxin system RelE/ParE family toxin [Salmonella enterica]|nr:type II toxin-antitoxin system RelE/ParE family toxin [Salmonella enterica subsp. salamae]EKN4990471.1 type II toxin-antitoxin system RelE/ParE family toxin [Salmonella enterica]EKT4204246.1 type II toxin-antitoxin system RelE/ParE family toxin [Salmonella enterica]
MFIVRYHPEAEAEATELPITIRVKYDKLVKKLEADPTQLREPHTKPLGGGVFELRTMGTDIARGLWVYQKAKTIYILRVFVKKTPKTPPGEIELALSRLEEMIKNGI